MKEEIIVTHIGCDGVMHAVWGGSVHYYDDEDEEVYITFRCEKCYKEIEIRV